MTARRSTLRAKDIPADWPLMFTLESFAKWRNLPGPTSPQNVFDLSKILMSMGYVDRGDYWSKKLLRKPPTKNPMPRVNAPPYVKVPPGAFSTLDLLERNNMRRYPENFAWAREWLAKSSYKMVPGTHRYYNPGRANRVPASVTGVWTVPGEVFTTYQFQVHNNVYRVHLTGEQWKSATDYLAGQGFRYDAKWRRWARVGHTPC